MGFQHCRSENRNTNNNEHCATTGSTLPKPPKNKWELQPMKTQTLTCSIAPSSRKLVSQRVQAAIPACPIIDRTFHWRCSRVVQ